MMLLCVCMKCYPTFTSFLTSHVSCVCVCVCVCLCVLVCVWILRRQHQNLYYRFCVFELCIYIHVPYFLWISVSAVNPIQFVASLCAWDVGVYVWGSLRVCAYEMCCFHPFKPHFLQSSSSLLLSHMGKIQDYYYVHYAVFSTDGLYVWMTPY